jgi:mutator protein MutT
MFDRFKKISSINEAVLGLIQNDIGEILVVARRGTKDMWGFPGGKVEFGEDHEGALRREVYEETGIIVSVGEYIYSNEVSGTIVTTYRVIVDLMPEDLCGDAGPVKWVTWGELIERSAFAEYNTAVRCYAYDPSC